MKRGAKKSLESESPEMGEREQEVRGVCGSSWWWRAIQGSGRETTRLWEDDIVKLMRRVQAMNRKSMTEPSARPALARCASPKLLCGDSFGLCCTSSSVVWCACGLADQPSHCYLLGVYLVCASSPWVNIL